MPRPLQRFSAAAIALLAPASHAATMSASATAPAVNGLDIANYGTVTGNDKWFAENSAAGAAKGQTFKTGALPVLLKSVSYQVTTSQQAAPTKQYTIRVGSVTGSTFTQIHSENATQSFQWPGGHYMTWTLATPVLLAPNTTYGVDVGMTSSTSAWQTGIPYINTTANVYSGGSLYNSGTSGLGTTTATAGSNDRIFHLDLQHPLNPVPDIGAVVPAGGLTLSWTNLGPAAGSDVWVDLWFGTDPNALSKVAALQQNLSSFPVNLPGAGTYYWRVDSYLDGNPAGTPTQGPLFSFIVTDSDSDGFPDEYELLHTGPPSATALARDDDDDQDGRTNWTEFGAGTSPSDPDSDNDGLLDGSAISVTTADPRHSDWAADGILHADSGSDRHFRGESTLGSNPLKPDTDGDGLGDGVETRTGSWTGLSDTGTDPIVADTDADGLKDGPETFTGTYASTNDTGTSPLNPDSDGDNAGDWYEVAIIDKKPSLGSPPNSPNDPALKPNIPYPLPDPDASTGVSDKPVKVYIMSGQSNMVGFGQIAGTGPGTLQTITGTEKKFPNLVATGGGWTTRSDVKYRGVITDVANGNLKPDVAGDKYGPELGFGYVMGWYHDEPVLLIKASQGNRGLMWDILPPGSPRTVYGATTFPAYGESPETWATATGGPAPFAWYAGKQYDDFFLKEKDMGPLAWAASVSYPVSCQVRHNGHTYISKTAHVSAPQTAPQVDANGAPVSSTEWNAYSVFNTADVLDDFASQYPQWAAQGFEIAGFVWWQGYDDTGEPRATRYEPNMVQFIKRIRSYYENRYNKDTSALTKVKPNAPFVLATLATNGGWSNPDPGHMKVAGAQLAVDGNARNAEGKLNYPEFAGNVKTVEARGFWRSGDASVSPTNQGYHYNWNAETYLLVGDALGRGMIDLLSTSTTGDYGNWAAAYPGADLTDPQADLDGDGMKNDDERLFGLDPTLGSSSNPISIPLSAAAGTFSYTRRDDALTGMQFTVWTSPDLSVWTQDESAAQVAATSVNGIETVTVTLSPGLTASPKLFVRVVAAP